MVTRDWEIHQAIYGYRDGHRLLAASRKLRRHENQILLGMSDLSGRSPGERFDPYVTVFPIQEEKTFVVARTWLASELPRPGCVWTRAALLRYSDVPTVPSLRNILAKLDRPKITDNTSRHLDPLHIGVLDQEQWSSNTGMPSNDVRWLLTALYSGDDGPIYVTTDVKDELEKLAVLIWDQQYPRLRRKFSFTTGAFRARKIEGVPIHLQIGPIHRPSLLPKEAQVFHAKRRIPSGEISIAHAEGRGTLGTRSNQTANQLPAAWTSVLLKDLWAGETHTFLRTLLWTYGSSTASDFHGMRDIAEVYTEIRRSNQMGAWDNVVAVVCKRFPEADEAVELKKALVDPASVIARSLNDTAFVSLVSETLLAKSRSVSVINEHLHEITKKIWNREKRLAIEIGERIVTESAARSEQYLVQLAGLLADDSSWRGDEVSQTLLIWLAALDPQLMEKKAFWEGVGAFGGAVLETAINERSDDFDTGRAISFARTAGVDLAPQYVIRYLDVDEIAQAISSDGPSASGEGGKRLSEWADNLMARADMLEPLLRDDSWFVGYEKTWIYELSLRANNAAPQGIIDALGRTLGEVIDSRAGEQSDTVLAANVRLALLKCDGGSVKFAGASIAEFYERLLQSRVSASAWKCVEEALGADRGLPRWDWAGALRHAVLVGFMDGRFELSCFFDVVSISMFRDYATKDWLSKAERKFILRATGMLAETDHERAQNYVAIARTHLRKAYKFLPDV